MTEQIIKGQIAIVTGASSGIGAGCAKSMAKAGATVVVNYPFDGAAAAAQTVADEIKNDGGTAVIYKCDVSKEDEVISMFNDTVKQFGTVDILVNNAGVQKDAPLMEMTLDKWNAVIGINLTGQFLCAREAIREFLRRGLQPERSKAIGKIICMSSVHEVIPWAGHVNYASSKGGILMMMKSIAQEFAPQKVRINSICPGAIQTPINQSAWGTPEGMKSLLTLIPYQRIGQPEDIGNLAVWLASDYSDYITGQSIFIDGGMTLYPGFATNG
jgi:glucose 1-dehydrogenase